MLGVKSLYNQSNDTFPYERGHIDEDNRDHPYEEFSGLKLDTGHLSGDFASSNNKSLLNPQVQTLLRQEILQLEKRLQEQVAVRGALEKALSQRPISDNTQNEISMTKPASELIKEISVLELEVANLEQYLLSLYRQVFDQHVSTMSPSIKGKRLKSPITSPKGRSVQRPGVDITSSKRNCTLEADCPSIISLHKDINSVCEEERLVNPGVLRCHSSLSQYSTLSTNLTSPPAEPSGRDVRACYSQPSSMMEYAQNTSNVISLAEYLGAHICDRVVETPNKLSEDMIKCISDIYCKLSNHGLSSPTSSLSSTSEFSLNDHSDMWSPGFKNSSVDARLDNPFHVQGLKEFSGPYSTMVEVQCLSRDAKKIGDVEHMLQKYRSLISQLEEIDPGKMNREEKLSFWINVHNALVMHAYLAYGIPRNNVKRFFLLSKAAYNIGGHIISVDVIQSSILGCRMSRPGQWLRLLLPSRSKLKGGDERQAYSIKHPEPLLHFGLCSGSHSDPAIRVYTSKSIVQDLQTAKDEYIRATFGMKKEYKILLPKIVESYTKDSGLCSANLIIEKIEKSLPETFRKSIRKCQTSKHRKNIEWVPHNFAFRYLISKSW